MTFLPKDDRTNFAQEERLGLPYWTMIWATCVVVDESKCLEIPIFCNFGASSIFTLEKADIASAACLAQTGSLKMISMTFGYKKKIFFVLIKETIDVDKIINSFMKQLLKQNSELHEAQEKSLSEME